MPVNAVVEPCRFTCRFHHDRARVHFHPVFPNGFPRPGDGYNVDVAGYGLPTALVARNALPGGNIWDSRSDHFRDEADRWRKNENRPVPFATKDVIDSAKERIVYTSP